MDKIICTWCTYEVSKREAERICSNCFACTGCERFACPQCGKTIEVVPLQGFRLKGANEKK